MREARGKRQSRREVSKRSAVGLLVLCLLLLATPQGVGAQEGGTNRAGLIVVHGDGRVLTRCVTFTEERISGVTLLQRSGLVVDANTGPMGSAVCTVNNEGCPANDCFCQCKGTPCTYWNYFHRNADGSWAYSGMGAATWTVGDGDVDGWVWGDGSAPPPALAFDTICNVASTAATTPASSTVAPTATRIPLETPIPTPTAPPIASATLTATAISATLSASTPSPSPSPTSMSSPTPTPAADVPLSTSPAISPTPNPTYVLSFPVVVSPERSSYRAPSPLLQYIPYALILICIIGLALLKRKR